MENNCQGGVAGLNHKAAEGIRRALKLGSIEQDVPMARFTSFRAGGAAEYLVTPGNEEELLEALAIIAGFGVPFFVLGNGTNLLVRDGGFEGFIIHIGKNFSDISVEGETLRAGAGALLSEAAGAALGASLGGLEFAAGIPGSVGGAVSMNAGAFGGEIKDVLAGAELAFAGGAAGPCISEAGNGAMGFSYRRCALCEAGGIVIGAAMKLRRTERAGIEAAMRDYAQRRAEKQPLSMPSAGSFFKRPEGSYAGRLISDAGLKGLSVGGAQVSELHAGFIVNRGGATAADICRLMEMVQKAVYERFGAVLEPEVKIIGKV
ncbi:MAG: UDP-N-acetylmuramate dehydrogenase [Clostridiales Family XIII bacterium]|jgi:UDP-N-acetylmuramate dehydrogenase|nr:UDP-N-acetylmuramate dehydrogenase [Clostridiales Family XIII bacterium]